MEGWWGVSYAILWILVLVLCAVVVALARQIGMLHLRLGPRGALELDEEGPPLGESPPPIEALAVSGETLTIGGPGEPQVLMFVSPGCHLCEQVLPALGAIRRSGFFEPRLITDADVFETMGGFDVKGIAAPVVPSRQIVQQFSVPGTPYVVVLDEVGVVRAKGSVNNLEQVEGLLDTARARAADANEWQVQ